MGCAGIPIHWGTIGTAALDAPCDADHLRRFRSPGWSGPRRNPAALTISLPSKKRLHVITWGCQMNVYDSGRMADVLAPLGYSGGSETAGAALVKLNTCHIRRQ